MELVGGDLNAYTTKEQTCIHSSFLIPHFDRAVELLGDIIFHSTFPENEIEKEKSVIIDEIDSYQDIPEEAIQDDFDGILFAGHSLGNNILGTPRSVLAFTKNDILRFIRENYRTDQIVLAVYGNIPQKKVMHTAAKYLSDIPANKEVNHRKTPDSYFPKQIELKKNINQSHAIIGNRAYDLKHPYKTAMLLLTNYLAGPGMSSRLNMEIREKHGICYSIDSSYSPMTDTGVFNIYMGTDPDKMDRCLKLVHKELKRLREQKLSTLALHQAKQKFIGQISLAEENKLAVIISIAKSVLDHGISDSLEEVYAKINAVNADEILEICNEVFDTKNLSNLIFNPKK